MDVAKDDKQAAHWYELSAKQGYADGQFRLAQLFANGQGVSIDQTKALEWYGKAASTNHAGAQYNLGTYLAHGIGTHKDLPQAAYWLSLATENHYPNAQANRDYVLALLSPAEKQAVNVKLKTEVNPLLPFADKQASIH